jgi:enoyl reductase-like protein
MMLKINYLLEIYLAIISYNNILVCPGGGIGRHKGLKIPR